METQFAVEMRVRILPLLIGYLKQNGVIYGHYPYRRWLWRVRPDDWPGGDLGGGIAFDETELESESETTNENQ